MPIIIAVFEVRHAQQCSCMDGISVSIEHGQFILVDNQENRSYNKHAMRLFRLFLILLLSVALPFTNVAAAAMVYCGQPAQISQSIAADHSDHSGEHAQHRIALDHSAVDEYQHDSSTPNDVNCNHCSYCQSYASVIVPPLASQSVHVDVPSAVKIPFTDLVPRTYLEEPFRPPALAFA